MLCAGDVWQLIVVTCQYKDVNDVDAHCDFRWTGPGNRNWFLPRLFGRCCYHRLCGHWPTVCWTNWPRNLYRRVIHRLRSITDMCRVQHTQWLAVRQKLKHVLNHTLHTRMHKFNGYFHFVWHSGQGVRLATPKVAGSTPGLTLSGNNLGQVVHTRASVTKQYKLVPVKGRWCSAAGKVTIGLA